MAESKVSIKTPKNTREDDQRMRAAALAAVFAYIDEEDDKASGISDKYRDSVGAWGKASLMEGAHLQPQISSSDKVKGGKKRSLWRSVVTGLALLVAAGFSNAAWAQPSFINHSQLPDKKTVYIRVGLRTGASKLDFDTFDGAEIINLASGQVVAYVKPEGKFSVFPFYDRARRQVALAISGKRLLDSRLIAKTPQNLSSIEKVAYFPVRQPLKNRRYKPDLLVSLKKAHPAQNPNLEKALKFFNGKASELVRSGLLIAPKDYLSGATNSAFSLNGRSYRGALVIIPKQVSNSRGRLRTVLNAVNIVDIDDYLLSVLPSEMPPKWPLEALKAQAIASRSYVIANLGKYRKYGYDVKATVADQVYKGIVKEQPSTNLAVAQTTGVVLKQAGKVIPAFFHSSAGGHTEVSEHVWSRALPYLNAVPDFDSTSPHLSWSRQFDLTTLSLKLGLGRKAISALLPIDRSPSNRVKNILVVSSDSDVHLYKGTEVRKLLKLPGTNFNIAYKNSAYVFAGQGFGHGLGMSQWGAKSLAEHGYNAAQILKYYYRDVTFGQVFEPSHL